MRQYYASDKKRREQAKRTQQAEKRMKKFNKAQKQANPGTGSSADTPADTNDVKDGGSDSNS